MSKEIEVTIPPNRLPPGVRSCPDCNGSGRNADGSGSMALMTDGSVRCCYRPASKCRLCDGGGLVHVEAYRTVDPGGRGA